MLRGATPRPAEMVGTAVLRIVVSSDSMKKATATSHGKRRLEAGDGPDKGGLTTCGADEFMSGKLRASFVRIINPGIGRQSARATTKLRQPVQVHVPEPPVRMQLREGGRCVPSSPRAHSRIA